MDPDVFFFNFRPTVLNYGVQELRVRLATADLLPLPMAQIAEHAMYVYFNQIKTQMLMIVVLKFQNTLVKKALIPW